jgi:hypothetical protein
MVQRPLNVAKIVACVAREDVVMTFDEAGVE